MVKDVIKEKGGVLIEPYTHNLGEEESFKVDGNVIKLKEDKKAFYTSLLNDYITYGYKELAKNNRYGWVESPMGVYGHHRNYGFEFYAFMEAALAFIKERGIILEDTSSFQEAVRAYLLSWDMLSFEKTGSNFVTIHTYADTYGVSMCEHFSSENFPETYKSLEEEMQREVAFYKNKPLQVLFEDLIQKGAYKYKSIPSNKKAFKRSFATQTFLMNKEEVKAFIAGYKAFLLKTGNEVPYSLDTLEDELMKLYEQVQVFIKPLDASLKDDVFLESLKALDGSFEYQLENEIDQLVSNFSKGDEMQMNSFVTSITSSYRLKKEESLKNQDREKIALINESEERTKSKMKNFFYPVYVSDEIFKVDGKEFVVSLNPNVDRTFFEWLKIEKPQVPQGKCIGSSVKEGTLLIRLNNEVKASFRLDQKGQQSSIITVEAEEYLVVVEAHENIENKAYRVNVHMNEKKNLGVLS